MKGETQQTLTGEDLPKFKENSWLKQWDSDEKTPESIMKKAIETFTIKHKRIPDEKPTFWVASSGGSDSMVVADMLDRMGMLEGVFHIKIYGGVKVTLEFIQQICKEKKWRLEVRSPYPIYIHVALILETGFPGFFLHPMYMNELKRKTIEAFLKEKEIAKKNPVLATGVRKFESERRFGNFEFPVQVDDAKVRYVCPIFYYKDQEKYEYILSNKVQSTPAKKKLGHSGECPCGSFAHPRESKEWFQVDPDATHFLKWLEYGVRHFGTPTAKKYAKWGGEGMTEAEAQTYLDQHYTPDEQQSMKIAEALACGTECGPGTMRGMLDF